MGLLKKTGTWPRDEGPRSSEAPRLGLKFLFPGGSELCIFTTATKQQVGKHCQGVPEKPKDKIVRGSCGQFPKPSCRREITSAQQRSDKGLVQGRHECWDWEVQGEGNVEVVGGDNYF
jgi:hypothetical protein